MIFIKSNPFFLSFMSTRDAIFDFKSALKGICNPSLNSIPHDAFVYKACQYRFNTVYFIGWLIIFFV